MSLTSHVSRLTSLTCVLVSTDVSLRAQDYPAAWDAPFNHVHNGNVGGITGTDAFPPFATANPVPIWPAGTFQAVHMAMIPKGPNQG